MKVFRDTSGDYATRIINDPEVDQGPLDLRPIADHPCVYALVGAPPIGTHICLKILDGIYEFHSAVLPRGRGEWMADFTGSSIEFMFVQTDCIELITAIPKGNLAATALARRFGFFPRWRCGPLRYKDQMIPFVVWSLTQMEWMPSGRRDYDLIVEEMQQAGQSAKAVSWQARRDFVSRSWVN